MSLEINETQFTPSEAEAITGVTVIQQRDFRRHGFIPKKKGHARFNAYELAELSFVKAMANCGIGPKIAFSNSEICANKIVYEALGKEGSVGGNIDQLIEFGLVSDIGISIDEARETIRTIKAEFPQKADLIDGDPKAFIVGLNQQKQRDFAQRYIGGNLGSRVLAANYFILWADGSEYWTESLDDAFDDEALQSPKTARPAIVMSLESVGYAFATALPRPMYSLNYTPPRSLNT